MNTKFQDQGHAPSPKRSSRSGWIKFLVILLILIVIGLYPVASYLQGQKSVKTIDEQLEYFNNQLSSLGIKDFKFIRTNKGDGIKIFSSDYVIAALKGGENYPIFDLHAEHGPLPFSELKQGHFSPIKTKQVLTLSKNSKFYSDLSTAFPKKDKEPLKIEYIHDYNDYINGELKIEEIFVNVNEKGKIKFSPITIKYESDADMHNVNSVYSQNNVLVDVVDKNERVYFEMHELKGTAKFQQTEPNKWAFEHVSNFGKQKNIINDVDIDIGKGDGKLVVTRDPLNTRLVSNQLISSVSIYGRPFGSYSTEIDIDNLHTTSLKQLGSLFATLFNEMLEYDAKNPKASPKAFNEHFERLLTKKHFPEFMAISLGLINNSPKINYSINFENSTGSMKVGYGIDAVPPSGKLDMKDPVNLILLLKQAYVKADFEGYWLENTLKEAAEVWAMKNNKPGASEAHKQEIKDIVHSLQRDWVDSGIMSGTADKASISVFLNPNQKDITKSQINFNGDAMSIPAFLKTFKEYGSKFQFLVAKSNYFMRLESIFKSYGEMKAPNTGKSLNLLK